MLKKERPAADYFFTYAFLCTVFHSPLIDTAAVEEQIGTGKIVAEVGLGTQGKICALGGFIRNLRGKADRSQPWVTY